MDRSELIGDPIREIDRVHHDLTERVAATSWGSVGEVLNLGAAVLLHASLERFVVRPRHGFLDPVAITDLEADHERMTRDLVTLAELWRTEPGSPDVATLASAIFERLRAHLARDDRAIYRPLVRLERARQAALGRQDGRYDPCHRKAPGD